MDIEVTNTQPAPDAGGSVDEKPKAEAKPDGAGVQETKAEQAERKFRLKYGKSERELSEKELIAEAQKGWASDEKFKSAKRLERELKEAIDKGDMDYLLQKKHGKSKLEWAKEVLKEELRRKTLSPQEAEEEDRKSRIAELEAKEAELLKRQEDSRLEQATRHYQEQYDREFSQAMKKHGLPNNKYVMGRAVKIAQEVLEYGEPDWDLVVGEAKRQVQEELADLVDQLDDGVGFLGEERARKISRMLVSKGMNPKEVAKIVRPDGSVRQEGEKTPVDSDDYFERKRAQWNK